ncbi:MAG: hypothetical protein JOZ55_07325, partial [Alphaproteobacteria bacterium]|nr:hypothetical protein [Alphaproteobacteria bacterium]
LAPSPAALLLTMGSEALVAFAFAGPFRQGGRAVLVSLPLNGVTQPVLYGVLQRFSPGTSSGWLASLALGELAVICVEALVYFACLRTGTVKISAARAVSLSAAANAVSAGLGLFVSIP